MTRTYGDTDYGDSTYGDVHLGPPEVFVEVWGAGSTAESPVWADITCDVRSISIDRGRQELLQGFSAGTATLTIANFDDAYSAWNDSSVWSLAGRFQTDVPIRVRMHWSDWAPGYDAILFTGTTDSVNDSWPGTVDAMVTVQATDGFKYLARAEGLPLVTPVGAGEGTNARLQRWLALTDWWQGTTLDPGTATFEATSLDGSVLAGMQEVEWNEGGFLFVGVEGTLVFHDRNAIEDDPHMSIVQARFLDQHPITAPVEPWTCYTDIVPAADETLIYNQATLGTTGHAPQTFSDADSVDWFGVRSYNNTSLILADDAQVLTLAQLIVVQHSQNERRIDSITIHPTDIDESDSWWVAGNVRLLDRIYVERHFPGGHLLTEELLVQGIHHEITATGTRTPEDWTTTYTTSRSLDIGSDWDADETIGTEGWDTSTWAV